MAAVVALLLGTRVAADLDRGFLDLPLATPVSQGPVPRRLDRRPGRRDGRARGRARSAGVWVTGRLVGVDFDPGRFALAGRPVVAVRVRDRRGDHAARGPDAEPRACVGDRRRRAGRRCTSSSSWPRSAPDWAWLAPVSAWDHFRTTELIDDGHAARRATWRMFALVAVAGWLAALRGVPEARPGGLREPASGRPGPRRSGPEGRLDHGEELLAVLLELGGAHALHAAQPRHASADGPRRSRAAWRRGR